MIKKLIFVLSLLSTHLIYAAAPAWQIQPSSSKLIFTATQNNAPVSGEFSSFTGEINFAPDQLNDSHIHLVIPTDSITTSYSQLRDTLKSPDWFDIKRFPQAEFNAQSFSKTGANTYTATGSLKLRDKTLPVTLKFTVKEFTSTHALVEGETVIKRNDFGIGQGEWAKTNQVKNEVVIKFVISADKK